MKVLSARPPVRVNSHLMILKSFQPHLQLIAVNNSLEGVPASVGAVNPWKLCLQETLHCSFSVHARHDHKRRSSRSGSISSAPQWTKAENISSSESSMGFQCQQRYRLVLSRHCQPWKADREGQQRCDVGPGIRCSGLVHSIHQSDQSNQKFLREYVKIRLSIQASNSLSKAKKALNRAPRPGKIVLRQGLPPTTKSVVKARHDPFRLPPFRTRTHALPVFMQVIFL